MRKLGARLVGSGTKTEQLTVSQKILLAAFAVVTVLTLAFPDFPIVSAAVEMCVAALVVLSVWWDFVKFVLASNEAFSLVGNRVSSQRANKNLKRTMLVLLFIAHILFLGYVLLSSFWQINWPGICDARSVDKNAHHVVEVARFYAEDVGQVVIAMSIWGNIAFFASKKKNRAASAVSDGERQRSWYVLDLVTLLAYI
jgi:hypothetical protein